jgi:hypothetical protein
MASVTVNASTVRIAVRDDHELNQIIARYRNFIAVIHQHSGQHLLVYDATTMLETVVAGCLQANG